MPKQLSDQTDLCPCPTAVRRVANAELVPRSGADAVKNLIMWSIGLWSCLVGAMCKSLELQMRKVPDS
ncbi:hypothetical protein STEG23_013441, partial [Scotinomys teguina]